MAGSYEIRLVDRRTQANLGPLTNAIPGKAYRELNNWGTFDFHIPTLDAQAVECRPWRREAQLWRDGKLVWWGPIIKRSASENLEWTHVQCYGLEFYFSRRFFGPLQINYATNGSFETGLSGWTVVGCTAAVDPSWKVKGAQSVRLTASAAGQESYVGQLITVSAHPEQAVVFRAAGVYRIDPTVTWIGPAIYERGLYIERLDGGVVQGDDYVWEPITEDALRDGSEVQVETPYVTVPAGETQTLGLRAYCPGGAINWDLLSVRVEESVSTAVGGEDAAVLMQRVVDYVQNGLGKSSLNMGFAYTPTGRQLPLRAYQFYDHGNVWESFREFIEANTADVGVVWNSAGTSRTFTVWGWPGRGSLKTDLQMDLSSTGRLASVDYEEDGEQSSTKVRALGQGSVFTREVGEATDTTYTDGLVLESVINAPLETPIGALDGWASAELDRTKKAVAIPKLTTHENAGSVIENLDLGDLIPVIIDYGWIQENTTRRVVGISIDCATDTVEPTVN